MRIDEVVRVQNPMGGDYKSQLDRDRAAAAVRAQRQANREIPNRGAVSGAKSGTDPQGGMFTPGAVTTKSYNNALTKQFARPAGQGKGLDIMGNPLKQPVQRKIEPAQQTPQQPTTAPTTPNWVGQNTNVPAVQRKQQAQQAQQQPNTDPADLALMKKATASLQGGPALNPQELEQVNAYRVDKGQPPIPAQQPTTQPAAQTTATAGTSAPAIAPTNVPQQTAPQTTDRPNPYMTPQANTPSEPKQPQTMPSEPVKIGGQKLNPNDPADAKMLQMIQKQLPQMPTPQVAAVKQVADKTLATRRRNKPKKRF
jgi:hypothetical protein